MAAWGAFQSDRVIERQMMRRYVEALMGAMERYMGYYL
jgi:hypothetical protein